MTTKLPPSYYLPIWEQAAEQEIGLHITTDGADSQRSLLNSLYACRQEFGGFEDLMIFQPHPIGTLYICRKSVELSE